MTSGTQRPPASLSQPAHKSKHGLVRRLLALGEASQLSSVEGGGPCGQRLGKQDEV